MSHQAELEMQVNDLDCLDKACTEVGAKLVLDQKFYKTYGNVKEKCDHAITVPGNTKALEIGVLKISTNPEAYQLKTDFFMGGYGLETVVGTDACKLNQAYMAAVFEKNVPFGWTVSRAMQQDGQLVLEAERM